VLQILGVSVDLRGSCGVYGLFACTPNRFVIAESCLRTLLVFWSEISSALSENWSRNMGYSGKKF